jgi:hypothetical protein
MAEIAEGWYSGRAVATGIGYTEGGTPQIAILLRVADDDPNEAGRTIQAYLYLTDAAQENTLEALRLMGFKSDDISDLDGHIDAELVLPNDIRFPVSHEEYGGKLRAKVGKICKMSASTVALKNKLEGNEAKQFGLRFRSVCKAYPAGFEPKPKIAAAKPRTHGAPVNEDADDCGDFDPNF